MFEHRSHMLIITLVTLRLVYWSILYSSTLHQNCYSW